MSAFSSRRARRVIAVSTASRSRSPARSPAVSNSAASSASRRACLRMIVRTRSAASLAASSSASTAGGAPAARARTSGPSNSTGDASRASSSRKTPQVIGDIVDMPQCAVQPPSRDSDAPVSIAAPGEHR